MTVEERFWAKVQKTDSREIRSRNAAGEPGQHIAKSLGVYHSTIYSILKGKTWHHVK